MTNAHCFAGPASRVQLRRFVLEDAPVTALPLFGDGSEEVQDLRILKSSSDRDLAELELPTTLEAKYCPLIDAVSAEDAVLVDRGAQERRAQTQITLGSLLPVRDATAGLGSLRSYVTVGFHRRAVQAFFSRSSDGSTAQGPEYLYRVTTSLPGLEHLYALEALTMLHGMSGGVTVDDRLRLTGLNVRFVDYQQEVFVIPVKDVLSFLGERRDQEKRNLSSRRGNNSLDDGGENSGGRGGENSGGRGSETDDDGGSSDTDLSFLREPDEGVLTDAGQRLLGMGSQQIDGWDDVRRLRKIGNPIYRESKEFDRLKPRLFERLAGFFDPLQVGQSVSVDHLRRTEGDERWKLEKRARPLVQVVATPVAARELKISLLWANYVLRDIGETGPEARVPAHQEDFRVRMSDDGETLELRTPANTILRCPNRYYLKLVCSSAAEEFSLSVDGARGPTKLRLRHSKLDRDQGGRPSIRYVYGSFEGEHL